MSADFFEKPILNSPYNYPGQHWELDTDGQPTNRLISTRRPADFITPVPKPKKRKKGPDAAEQMGLLTFTSGFSTEDESGERQEYNATDFIMGVRTQVDRWRKLPESAWKVTPETARLLKHWRSHPFHSIRPFFCQIEAVETAIWLTEVAPRKGKFWDHIESANEQSNPELLRVALKLATGAGKTMVMSMLIAWQTINAVRHPQSNRFTRGFLIVAPGITIKDRLRVLFPNDPDSYYQQREIVPNDMLPDLGRAKIVVTNYHSFKLRERIKLAKG
ncbi:MAG: type III restriction enzyme, partial [Candidatus Promineifilaceae bacterium]